MSPAVVAIEITSICGRSFWRSRIMSNTDCRPAMRRSATSSIGSDLLISSITRLSTASAAASVWSAWRTASVESLERNSRQSSRASWRLRQLMKPAADSVSTITSSPTTSTDWLRRRPGRRGARVLASEPATACGTAGPARCPFLISG